MVSARLRKACPALCGALFLMVACAGQAPAVDRGITDGGGGPGAHEQVASAPATVALAPSVNREPAPATPAGGETAAQPAATATREPTAVVAPATSTRPPLIVPATPTQAIAMAPPTALAPTPVVATTSVATASATPGAPTFSRDPHPLQIEVMRQQSFMGSALTVERTLERGSNYTRYLAAYQSDGNRIDALLTVPDGSRPASGWPVIVFVHGFIPPAEYRTTERYIAYVDAFARNGYIVLKTDLRGHGNSEGRPVGGYGAPDYTNDVLNAVATMKAFELADPQRIGIWGHSMGGHLALRAMVVSQDIRAGVIWAGVVGPYPDIFVRPTPNPAFTPRPTRTPTPGPTPRPDSLGQYGLRNWRQDLAAKYGSAEQNPQFWESISPGNYLAQLSGPVQLHHGTADAEVPLAASHWLLATAEAIGAPVSLFTYPGDNHNISNSFGIAMQRSLAFFDRYVKGSP